METLEKKGKGSALLPFLLFIVIYLGAGLYFQAQGVEMAFYQFPSVTAMFIALLLAFCQGKGTIDQKFTVFAKGAANENVLTMLMIYILAGAFSTVASAMGGVDATVNLGLSVIPVHFLAAGVFVISAFMGTATGTSMGTISAIVPIAVGVAEKGGLSLPLFLGACVGGAMFGDNLSMISDTTIAATRTQGCQLRDKFRVNFLIALPAAIITIIVLLVVGRPETVTEMGNLSFNVIKVIPYLAVLVLALIGMNVFLVLTIGIFAAGIIGLALGDLDIGNAVDAEEFHEFAQQVCGKHGGKLAGIAVAGALQVAVDDVIHRTGGNDDRQEEHGTGECPSLELLVQNDCHEQGEHQNQRGFPRSVLQHLHQILAVVRVHVERVVIVVHADPAADHAAGVRRDLLKGIEQ